MTVSYRFQERNPDLVYDVQCLSTDEKPEALTGCTLTEADTGNRYSAQDGVWEQVSTTGPPGLMGPTGSTGAGGPTGPTGVAGGENTVRLTSDVATSAITGMTNVTGLVFALSSGTTYGFEFGIIFRSGATTNGIRLGLTFPAATIVAATARIPIAADGAAGEFQGWITSSGDSVIGTAVQAVDTNYFAKIEGTILPSADGNLQVQYASELATARGTVVKEQSFGILKIIA